MWRCSLSIAVLLLASGLTPSPSPAQSTSRFSLQATLGPSLGRDGGVRRHRDGVAIDGILMWRARPLGSSFAVIGVGGGNEGPYAGDDSCWPAPNGGCLDDFPNFSSIALLAGLERNGRVGSARLVAGPAQYRGRGEGGAFGVQGRLELATPAIFHAALAGSVRGGLIPRLNGERYRLFVFGLGVRLQ